jgi:hypothetical protein
MLDLPFSFAKFVPYEDFERVVSEYDNELRKQTDLANAWKLIAGPRRLSAYQPNSR